MLAILVLAQVVTMSTPQPQDGEKGRQFRHYAEEAVRDLRVADAVDIRVESHPNGYLGWSIRLTPGRPIVAIDPVFLRGASQDAIHYIAAHEVCHVALRDIDALALGLVAAKDLNDHFSPNHMRVYACVIKLAGKRVFCNALGEIFSWDRQGCNRHVKNVKAFMAKEQAKGSNASPVIAK